MRTRQAAKAYDLWRSQGQLRTSMPISTLRGSGSLWGRWRFRPFSLANNWKMAIFNH